jgi:hypothetical protein
MPQTDCPWRTRCMHAAGQGAARRPGIVAGWYNKSGMICCRDSGCCARKNQTAIGDRAAPRPAHRCEDALHKDVDAARPNRARRYLAETKRYFAYFCLSPPDSLPPAVAALPLLTTPGCSYLRWVPLDNWGNDISTASRPQNTSSGGVSAGKVTKSDSLFRSECADLCILG